MKKFLSIFFCILLLLSVISIGFTVSAEEYQVGDVIEYGSYPQSKVTDSSIISALNKDTSQWISYGYYVGTDEWADGNMRPSDFMYYKDVTYNGNKYRAVEFDSYRPDETIHTQSAEHSYQDDNGYTTGNVYWFRYDPVKWRILDTSTGLVMCESIVDSQAYNNCLLETEDSGEYCYGDSSCTYPACDYAKSDIREWLNDDFYNTAFSEEQQGNIIAAELDNSGVNDSEYGSASTTDNVFLLSYNDVVNSSYGFDENEDKWDYTRRLKGTDYAKCQGLIVPYDSDELNYSGYSPWHLRTPTSSEYDWGVFGFGYAADNFGTYGTYIGVVPAIRLSNITSYKIVQTAGSKDTPEKGANEYDKIGSNNFAVGDSFEFGSYPQTEVTDESVISELNKDKSEWIDYNYCLGGEGDAESRMNFMRYKDVSYNGKMYRGVTFDEYRTGYINYNTDEHHSPQSSRGYYTDTVYWFEYEPLEWTVLDPSTGLVLCNTIIDSQSFCDIVMNFDENCDGFGMDGTLSENGGFAGDWATSSIRKWLSDSFYNTAFDDNEKADILVSRNSNFSEDTLNSFGYIGNYTDDKIFLLSTDDISNSDYGFISEPEVDDAKICYPSDYAKCQGIGDEYGSDDYEWSLRTTVWVESNAIVEDGNSSKIINEDDGSVNEVQLCYYSQWAEDPTVGIRPAMRIDLSKAGISEESIQHAEDSTGKSSTGKKILIGVIAGAVAVILIAVIIIIAVKIINRKPSPDRNGDKINRNDNLNANRQNICIPPQNINPTYRSTDLNYEDIHHNANTQTAVQDFPISTESLNQPGVCKRCGNQVPMIYRISVMADGRERHSVMCADCTQKFIRAYNSRKK